MADKQGNLNGAFYGPSIPPPQQSKPNYRHSRSRSCCCCLFSVLWKILLVLIVLLVIVGFIFWLVVRPTKIKLHVTEASLTQFNLTSTNILHYNLALNVTMRNPNRKLGVYNDRIEAKAFFEGARFDSEIFTDLGLLKKKSSKDLRIVFEGQHLLALDADEIKDFNEQKTAGVFDIDVKFYLRNRLRLGDFIGGKFKPKIKCDLKVPLITNGVSSGTFQKTKCDVDFF